VGVANEAGVPTEQSWLQVALDALDDPVITLEPVRDQAGAVIDFVCRQANAAACVYNGMTRDELLGARMLETFPGMTETGLFQADVDVLVTGIPLVLTDMAYGNEQLGSEERRYDFRTVRAGDALVVTWRDVTERSRTARALRALAATDSLTGLTSRTEGLAQLRRALGHDQRRGRGLAVAFLDVDGLKKTNDELGHVAGDALLRSTALRIRSCVRDSDEVVRVGGDEIVLLLHGVVSVEAAADVCEKVCLAAALPIRINDQDATTTVSIGVTMARADDDVESVLARADAGMYESKHAGGNRTTIV
jgi:diguanylate cyclase (GGDEF)-like protein